MKLQTCIAGGGRVTNAMVCADTVKLRVAESLHTTSHQWPIVILGCQGMLQGTTAMHSTHFISIDNGIPKRS